MTVEADIEAFGDEPEPNRRLMRKMMGGALSNTEPVGTDGRRFVRRFVVRSERELPAQAELDTLAERLTAEAERTLRRACGEDAPEERMRWSLPVATMIRIDPTHCVVTTELPNPGHAMGDAAAIGTWGILRGVDEALSIEDLQGIPKQFWFALK